jgi:hypothetical protein
MHITTSGMHRTTQGMGTTTQGMHRTPMAMHMATLVTHLAALAILGWGETMVGGRNANYIPTIEAGSPNIFPGVI